jgi:hypothetical protein
VDHPAVLAVEKIVKENQKEKAFIAKLTELVQKLSGEENSNLKSVWRWIKAMIQKNIIKDSS